MEQDNQLKEILSNSAQGASAYFTETVMQRVNNLAEAPFYYQSLVNPKLKRVFLFCFGALLTAIFGLFLIIALSKLPFADWIKGVVIPDLNYDMILMFIITFWIVFTINSLIEKKSMLPKSPFHTS